MLKLTKAQRKDRMRIECWLTQRPFRENARTKPIIPNLTLEQVLTTYVPPAIQEMGQFFTPSEMARQAFSGLNLNTEPHDILELCGGIGHLLFALLPHIQSHHVTICELNQECYLVGSRLFPWATWRWASPWDLWPELEGRFDLVLANPPFGTTCGMYDASAVCVSQRRKTERAYLSGTWPAGAQARWGSGVHRPADFYRTRTQKDGHLAGTRGRTDQHVPAFWRVSLHWHSRQRLLLPKARAVIRR